MIGVDYLQLQQGSSRQASENRVNEISEITRGLKTPAKELNLPVLALSQLSRQVEQREDKRPQLSDLREPGTTEQVADKIGRASCRENVCQDVWIRAADVALKKTAT